MVTLWWSATGLIHYSFLNPGEIITSEKSAQQIDAIHSKLQCLQLTLVNRKGPVLLHDNSPLQVAQVTLQKFNKLVYDILPCPPYSPDLSPTTTSSSILTTFCRENASTTNRMQKMISKSSQNHGFLFYRNKLISHWQKRVDCNGSYFD